MARITFISLKDANGGKYENVRLHFQESSSNQRTWTGSVPMDFEHEQRSFRKQAILIVSFGGQDWQKDLAPNTPTPIYFPIPPANFCLDCQIEP